MQIFLAWHSPGGSITAQDLDSACAALKMQYLPLLNSTPQIHTYCTPFWAHIYLEIPVEGWLAPFIEKDGTAWALSLDYPIGIPNALAKGSCSPRNPRDFPLLALAGAFEAAPLQTIEALAPPFTLIWEAPAHERVFIQNDGLGFAQLFEYRHPKFHAFSNRIAAFQALGLPLCPSPVDWAVKCSLGWFPLLSTGYENIQMLAPATQLEISAHGVRSQTYPVLKNWIKKENLDTVECQQLAHRSLKDFVLASAPLWDQAHCGLTGGQDSRAIGALLIGTGAEKFYFRTRGAWNSHDVLIARRLANIAKVVHRFSHSKAMPPPREADLRFAIQFALQWQGGQIELQNHKMFQRDKHTLEGGSINFMGQHGELGRGFYQKCLPADSDQYPDFDSALETYALRYTRPFLKPEMREQVHAIVRQAIRQADLYDLEGQDRLDFFYLFERTRRWASGGHFAQPGKILAPFLNPGYMRAAFNLEPTLRTKNLFHQYIVMQEMPAWNEVPFNNTMTSAQRRRWNAKYRAKHAPKKIQSFLKPLKQLVDRFKYPYLHKYSEHGARTFNNRFYWESLGKKLIQEALASSGLWEHLYALEKPDAWTEAPDDFVVLHYVDQLNTKN